MYSLYNDALLRRESVAIQRWVKYHNSDQDVSILAECICLNFLTYILQLKKIPAEIKLIGDCCPYSHDLWPEKLHANVGVPSTSV